MRLIENLIFFVGTFAFVLLSVNNLLLRIMIIVALLKVRVKIIPTKNAINVITIDCTGTYT